MNDNGGGMGGACYVYPGAPATPDRVTPDVTFTRGIYMGGSMRMDDGRTVTIWGFTGDGSGGMMGGQFPSPIIRVREGQIVHTTLSNQGMMWLHTIHHHGIEPSDMNDGVGHTSFDVNGTYTYQWKASNAGTYFYHCHTNTVLHAEMGMYGALIVDPPDGIKRAFTNGPFYDVEAIWAADEIDSSWHSKSWDAGTCGGDAGLNNLRADYFIISGVDGANSALTDPRVAVTMARGKTLLVRYINAGYYPQRINFGSLPAVAVASDGRPLPAAMAMSSLRTTAAERYDFIITPTATGVYPVVIEFLDWATGAVKGKATTRITVT